MAEILEYLASMPYFAGLSQDELKKVKDCIAFEKTIKKGEILLHEGDLSEYIYFVVSGSIKVYKQAANGKEQILNITTFGDSLNDVSAFDGGGSSASMLAMTPVRLYGIKIQDLEKLFRENPKIARNIVRVLASRVRRDSSLVEVLSFSQVTSRLARLILHQAAASGVSQLPHFTQQELAAMVGTSRVVINRSLRAIEDKGAIRMENRRIVITNDNILKDLVK